MTTTFDNHVPLAYSLVATAPSPATSGTSLGITTGDHTKFPAAPFNVTLWPGAGATASTANAEIVRVTAIAGDTFTIIRAQEGTTAQSIAVGYQVAATGTPKLFTDIENAINAALGGSLSGTLPNPTIAAGAVGTTQLATGAVTQVAHAYGVASNPTTTSGTYVDVPDMAVTLTTVGGDLLVWGHCDVSNSVAGDGVSVAVSLDGATPVGASTPSSGTAGQVVAATPLAHFAGVAAGIHTVKLRWEVSFGGTATATATERQMIVEEIRR